MARIGLKSDAEVPGARVVEIIGDTREGVQGIIDRIFSWIESLPGHNFAEFSNPVRTGENYVSSGYTLISDESKYDTLRLDELPTGTPRRAK